ncbi:MAG: hypothetical protein GY906_12835 [bacterium]|nr:hypothetical protein [bacterium]
MPLVQGDGAPIPEIPRVRVAVQDDVNELGFRTGTKTTPIIEVYGDCKFFLLDCGHRVLTTNVDPADLAFNLIPCRRCWETLIGTEESE